MRNPCRGRAGRSSVPPAHPADARRREPGRRQVGVTQGRVCRRQSGTAHATDESRARVAEALGVWAASASQSSRLQALREWGRSRETRTRGPRRHHQGPHRERDPARAWARAVPHREIARMRADIAKSVEDDEPACARRGARTHSPEARRTDGTPVRPVDRQRVRRRGGLHRMPGLQGPVGRYGVVVARGRWAGTEWWWPGAGGPVRSGGGRGPVAQRTPQGLPSRTGTSPPVPLCHAIG